MTDLHRLNDLNVDGKITSTKQGTLIGGTNTMPTPSADYDGVVIQYTGFTTTEFTTGTFYVCQELVGTGWKWVANNASGGGGGGSTVVWTQVATTGEKIAAISVNSVSQDVKVPYATGTSGGLITSAEKTEIGKVATIETAVGNKQDKSLSTANVVVVTDASGNIAAGSVGTDKLGYLSNVTSDIQNQLGGKVDQQTGYGLAKITLNGASNNAPTFYALTSAGTADQYVAWDTATGGLIYKNLPGFINIKGNKTGDDLNTLIGSSAGETWVCTADSTTSPQKYKDTAYFWTSDNTWAVLSKTSIDMTDYQKTVIAGSSNVVLVLNASGVITASSVTTTALGYIANVTSDIQAQLDAKQATLTSSEQSAVASGITSTKVGNYDSHIADTSIHVTSADKTTWNGKQDALVGSGTGQNIKTINGNSLLGTGDISVGGTPTFAGISGDPMDNTNLAAALNAKQATLVGTVTTGQNIKTVGGATLLGTGDIPLITADWNSTTLPMSAKTVFDKIVEYGASFKGSVATLTDLSTITGMNINDWAIVITDTDHSNKTSRYGYTGSQWSFQHTFNDTTFSSAQLDALNSGATSSKISSYESHVTSTANPHGVTATQVQLGNVVNTGDSDTPEENGTKKFTTGGAYTELNKKVDANAAITGATFCKITFDSKGLVTGGADLLARDIPNLASNKITAMTDYAKATSETSIATSDSLNVAIGKLEYAVGQRAKGTGTIGSATQPVYLSSGAITKCTYTLAKSVPSDAVFTDTVTTVSSSGTGNAVTAITASGGALTVTKGSTFLTSVPNIASNKVTAMTGYTIATSSSSIATTDSLNTAIGKLEYKANNVSASTSLTGYTIATSSSAVAATDTINAAIAKLEYRLKQLEDANLVRYS